MLSSARIDLSHVANDEVSFDRGVDITFSRKKKLEMHGCLAAWMLYADSDTFSHSRDSGMNCCLLARTTSHSKVVCYEKFSTDSISSINYLKN